MAKTPEHRTPWDGIIVTDESVCMGKVRIVGTRLYLDHLLGLIEGGYSLDDILADYPHLTRAQLQAMLGFTRDLVAAKRNRLKGEHHHG
ncbi:DUF433 domain-containing protein [Sphingomonas echinoides]|uniref:DUF433 domain-containing protein n=1 Tax=Sphingomonas echinoides TaxID=59803 RepID=A0ABU4PRX7_9SPHN|nr:DUF433 domain-containing protein [Sphingomonas echinoides]MDX5985957.1 DUF433 domain-containing protein [Sphingomonas echinoides]